MLLLTIMQFLTIRSTKFCNSHATKSDCISKGPSTTEVTAKEKCNGVKFINEVIDDYYYEKKDSLDEDISKEVSRERYIECSYAIITKYLGPLSVKEERDMKEILSLVHLSIGTDSKTLALFTASAFHNTSYLSTLRAASMEKYRCRGLLMIWGPENYEILNRFSSGTDFFKSPEEVTDQNSNVVHSTVCFFKEKMKGYEYNFVNMMKALGTEEYTIYINSGCVEKDPRWLRRETLYKMMKAVY